MPDRGRLRLGPIAGFQAAVLAVGTLVLWALGRGSIASLIAGGVAMLGSLVLQRFTVSMALRPDRPSGLAILFLLLKLSLVLAIIYIGFQTTLLAPMSFAAGATSLPVAIVLDVCYLEGSSRRSREDTP